MDDPDLMREIMETLIDDTGRQLRALERALSEANAKETVRVAHYSKGACANVGAVATAEILQEIERQAKEGNLAACGARMASLHAEFEKLRSEAAVLSV